MCYCCFDTLDDDGGWEDDDVTKEIEFDYTWHGKPPTKEEEQKFLKELRTLRGKIESTHHD